MAKYDQLVLKLIYQNNGYLHIRQIDKLGIDRAKIYPSIRSLELKRVARGVYCPANMKPDYMYLVCARNHEVILSHESSAFLHGLLQEEPDYVSVTTAHGYNAKHLTEKWVTSYQAKREWFEIGKERIIDQFGNNVCAYNPERTVCDFIHEMDYLKPRGNQMPEAAIANYFTYYQKRNIERLAEYACTFRISAQVSQYLSKYEQ